MKTNKNGVKLLAAITALAMVFIAGFAIIGGDNSSVDAAGDATPDTGIAKIGADYYSTLDKAVDAANVNADDIDTIELLGNATLSKFLKNVIIQSSGESKYTITLEDAIQLDNAVTLNNVEISNSDSNTTGFIFYRGYGTTAYSIEFTGVSFDSSCGGKTVYLDTQGAGTTSATFVNVDFTNSKIVYIGNDAIDNYPRITLNNVTNVDMNVQTVGTTEGNEPTPVIVGTNIIVAGETTVGTVKLANSILSVPQGTEFTADTITTYENLAGSVDAEGTISVNTTTVPISGSGDITVVDGGMATTFEQAKALLDAGIADVTLSSNVEIEVCQEFIIGPTQTLTIINTTVKDTVNVITVRGDLVIDNSYVYAGVNVDEEGSYTIRNGHKLTSSGTLNNNTYVGFGDELTLSGTVPSGISIHAFGKLVINDLTVNGNVNAYIGSEIVINGKVTVANKFTLNNAVLDLSGTIEVKNDKNGGAQFELAGYSELTVKDGGLLKISKATANGAEENKLIIGSNSDLIVEGTLEITGTLQGTVQDKGTVTFNGKSDSGWITLYDGMEITILSVTGTIVIDVDGIIDDTNADGISDEAEVSVTNAKGVKIASSAEVLKDKTGDEKYYLCNLTVSGNVSAVKGESGSVKLDADESASVEIDDVDKNGKITVVDTLTLNENITLSVEESTVATIEGNVNVIAKESSIVNDGELIVNGLITINDNNAASTLKVGKINATYYKVTDSEGTVISYYCSFAYAIEKIADADDKTIEVLGAVDAASDASVPAGSIVTVTGTLTIKSGAAVTVEDGASMNVDNKVSVSGTLIIVNNDTGLTLGEISYQVYTENGKTSTYTTLTNALKNAKAGDVITLSGDVTFSSNATIPEDVTVNVGKNKITLKKDVVLTVDGTLAFDKTSTLVNNYAKDIVVNGVVSLPSSNTDLAEKLMEFNIDGAYFMIKNTFYVTNVEYATENCHEGYITIAGAVSTGDVTFTAKDGEELEIIIQNFDSTNKTTVSAGTITITDGVILGAVNDTDNTGGRTPTGKAIFSGTIASKSDGADVSMKFDRASGFALASMAEDEVDGKVDYLYLFTNDFSGKATIFSGKVTADSIEVGATENDVITIASGAVLTVPEGSELIVGENGLIVDGTLDVKGEMDVVGKAVINGAMNVEGDGVAVTGELVILGTLLMKEEASGVIEGELVIDDDGSLIVGERIGTLGATGTVIGKVTIDGSNDTGYVKAYPGSDITGVKINYVVDASEAKSTSFYINGELYMTVYALSGEVNAISVALASDWVNNTVGLNISGIDTTGAKTPAKWFTDAAYTDPLATDITVGAEESIYFDAPISEAAVKVSVGTGMSLWIDGVKYTSGSTPDLKVGEHSVQVTINPGYKGTASITFNGTTVSNGKIVITADMVGAVNVLSAMGDITIDTGDTPTPVQPTEKDDGMGITDYLLIILVVLAAILVVIVAIRMMRS